MENITSIFFPIRTLRGQCAAVLDLMLVLAVVVDSMFLLDVVLLVVAVSVS